MELLDYMTVIFLIIWGISILFFIVIAPVYIATKNAEEFSTPQVLTNTCVFCLLDNNYPNRYVVISHCGFDFISLIINDVKHFLGSCLPSVFFRKKKSLQILCPFLNQFSCSYVNILCIWIVTPCQRYDLQIFSPIE